MSKKPARSRTARREAARDFARAKARLERLAEELPGGSSRHPLSVSSASVIEIKARATRCLACDGELRVDAHEAEAHAGEILRRVDLTCQGCRARRRLWFRVAPPLAS